MRKAPLIILILVAAALVTVGYFEYTFYFSARSNDQDIAINNPNPSPSDNGNPGSPTPIATANYVCDSGLTIAAQFYNGPTQAPASPDQPPVPGGRVELVLSDGEQYDLSQTISADGARYATPDESFVFWSKGNGALIMKNNQMIDKGCISVAADPGGLPKIYSDGTTGFSLRYPEGYAANPHYQYQELGPGQDINGVSFTIPESLATGTNLSDDTNLSVEFLPNTPDCRADKFLEIGPVRSALATTTDNGVTYSFASSTGAGAGNRYEETVYALPDTNPCLAVRYFIHYGVLENYPVGMVKAFDRTALLKQFDAMRRTFTIQQ